jgi:hypothetical protein
MKDQIQIVRVFSRPDSAEIRSLLGTFAAHDFDLVLFEGELPISGCEPGCGALPRQVEVSVLESYVVALTSECADAIRTFGSDWKFLQYLDAFAHFLAMTSEVGVIKSFEKIGPVKIHSFCL